MFYAAIRTRTIHHEGDEESRQWPGHGYPAHDESVNEFIEFKSEDAMKKWWIDNRDSKCQIVRCEPVNMKIEAVVTVTAE